MGSQDELLWLVRHRVRRRILLAVGDAGRISATALRDKLGISTGSLYYNLRQLSPLIKQDQKRNYMLTEQGEMIYKIITQQMDELPQPKPRSRFLTAVENIIFPVWVFSPIYENPKIALIVSPLALLVMLFLFINARYEIILLHAIKPSSFILNDFWIKTTLTLLASFVYLSLVSSVVSGSIRLPKLKNQLKNLVYESLKFLACIAVALLPMSLLPGVSSLDRIFNIGLISNTNLIIRDAILVVSQTLTVFMLTAAIAYSKRMRWQAALAVAFSYFYLSYGASYFIF